MPALQWALHISASLGTLEIQSMHQSPAIRLASAGLRVYVSSMVTNLGSTDCSTACFGAMADRKMFKAACTGSLCLGQRPLYAWTILSMTCRHCCSTASSTVSSSANTLARATSSTTCIGKGPVAASKPQTGRQMFLLRSCAQKRMPDPTHNAQQCAQIMKPMNLLDTRRTTWQQLQDASTTDYCIVMIEII
jgi:hypothetical protein